MHSTERCGLRPLWKGTRGYQICVRYYNLTMERNNIFKERFQAQIFQKLRASSLG